MNWENSYTIARKAGAMKKKVDAEVLESLKALVKVFVEGRNYETINPYCRPEIKAALKAIGKATGQNCDYYDVLLLQLDDDEDVKI